MCGQSLGLQPKSVPTYVADVLQTWATKGVHCHFSGNLPAAHCDLPPKGPMARLVGAKASEVVIMNGLTVNLHLMLCSFYRPTQHRYKIMIEDHAFSSDMVCPVLLLNHLPPFLTCLRQTKPGAKSGTTERFLC